MIKKIMRKFFYSPYAHATKNGASVGAQTILTRDFEVINALGSPHSVQIGEKCILGCQIHFESKTGKVSIGDGTYIGSGTKLISIQEIEIGNDVTIAWGVTIYDHDSHSVDPAERVKDQEQQLRDWSSGNFIANKNWAVVKNKKITIQDHAWLGFDVVVLKGVTIGEGAVVGARSVVTRDVEPWTVVAGNPAQVVKQLR